MRGFSLVLVLLTLAYTGAGLPCTPAPPYVADPPEITSYPFHRTPTIVDVDNNGFDDAIVTETDTNLPGPTIWLADASGLAPPVPVSPGSNCHSGIVQVVELTGDDFVDILCYDGPGRTDVLLMFEGFGNGSFAPAVPLGTSGYLYGSLSLRATQVHDVDGDGDWDIVNSFDDKIAWVENDPSAPEKFVHHQVFSNIHYSSSSFAGADMNHDGLLDFVFCVRNYLSVWGFASDAAAGKHAFQSSFFVIEGNWFQGWSGSHVYDVNLDGVLDLVVGQGIRGPKLYFGSGTFSSSLKDVSTVLPGGGVQYIHLHRPIDLNHDGIPDLVHGGGRSPHSPSYMRGALMNMATSRYGSFTDAFRISQTDAYNGQVVDFDNDGRQDYLFSGTTAFALLPVGSFDDSSFGPLSPGGFGSGVVGLAAADFSGHGATDVVVMTDVGTVHLWPVGVDGGYDVTTASLVYSSPSPVTAPLLAGDVTKDGLIDVVVYSEADLSLTLVTNEGLSSSPFGASTPPLIFALAPLPFVSGAAHVTIAHQLTDLDGDGMHDVLVFSESSLAYVRLGESAASSTSTSASVIAFQVIDTSGTAFSTMIPVSADSDSWTDVAGADGTTLVLWRGSGGGVFGPKVVVYDSGSGPVGLLRAGQGGGLDWAHTGHDLVFTLVGTPGLSVLGADASSPSLYGSSPVAVPLGLGPDEDVTSVWLSDIDGDYLDDLVWACGPCGKAGVARRTRGGGWDSMSLIAATEYPDSNVNATHVLFADLDHDSYIDVVLGGPGGAARAGHIPHFGTRASNGRAMDLRDAFSCGGVLSMACVSGAVARSTACKGRVEVDLGGQTVRGCHTGRSVPDWSGRFVHLFNGVIDCTESGGGALFVASGDNTDIVLEDVQVIGATQGAPSSLATAPVSVYGGAVLRVINSSFVECSSADALNFQPNHGTGGALAIYGPARVELTNCSFVRNVAGVSGGALALQDASATLSRVTFVGNSAGRGGAISLVTSASSSASLYAEQVRFESNVATKSEEAGGDGRGGGMAVTVSTSGVTVVLKQAEFVGNTAMFVGGGLALDGYEGVMECDECWFDGNSAMWGGLGGIDTGSTNLVSGLEGVVSLLALNGPRLEMTGARMGSSSAQYGGVFFVCDATVDVAWATPSAGAGPAYASIAGGTYFACIPENAAWVTISSPVGDSRAGAWSDVGATPPTSLEIAVAPAVDVISGYAIGPGGALVARDQHGGLVKDGSLVLEATISASSPAVVGGLGAATRPDLATGYLPLDSLVVTCTTWPEGLGVPVPVFVSLASGVGPVEVSVAPGPCPPDYGRVSSISEPLVCDVCGNAKYSVNTSTTPCIERITCGAGAVFVDGACVTCPPLTYRLLGNESSEEPGACVCSPGSWSPSGVQNVPCVACPVGGSCEGGLSLPRPLPGWTTIGHGVMEECIVPEACSGSNACATGYKSGSPMCKDCDDGYHRVSDGTCVECPPGSSFIAGTAGLAVIGVGVVAALVVRASEKAYASGEMQLESRVKRFPHSLSIGLLFVQILGVLALSPFGWPDPPVLPVLRVMNFLNVDLSIFAVGCTLTDFFTRYIIAAVLPLFLAGVIVLGVAASRLFGGGGQVPIMALVERAVFMLGPCLYLPLSRSILLYFDCTKLPTNRNGGSAYWLDAEYSVECFAGRWMTWVPLAVVATLLYVCGLPAYVGCQLYRVRKRLNDPLVLLRFGTLYNHLRRRFFFYELLLLIKRLAISSVVLFFSSVPVWIFGALIGIFIVSLVHHQSTNPHYFPHHGRLEVQLNMMTILVVVSGILFWANAWPSSASYTVVAVICLGAIVFGLSAIVYATMLDIRIYLRTRKAVGAEHVGGGVLNAHDARFMSLVEAHLADVADGRVREAASHFVLRPETEHVLKEEEGVELLDSSGSGWGEESGEESGGESGRKVWGMGVRRGTSAGTSASASPSPSTSRSESRRVGSRRVGGSGRGRRMSGVRKGKRGGTALVRKMRDGGDDRDDDDDDI